MSVVTDPNAGVIAAVSGDLDLAAAATFIDAIDTIFAESPSAVTLDLAEVSFLDSSGLGAMLTLHARCHSAGVDFATVNAPRQVSRVLEVTNLTNLFNLH